MIVVKNAGTSAVSYERKQDVARIFLVETNETVAYNVFNASKHIKGLSGNGKIELSEAQLNDLTECISSSALPVESFKNDSTPKFVVGFVQSCKKHPDSDHLNITQTEIDGGEVVQIVCGAANVKAGLKVVVAKVGAMMPDGLIIWPGELRGEKSMGMICSAKELGLEQASNKKGILELPFDAVVGEAFTF